LTDFESHSIGLEDSIWEIPAERSPLTVVEEKDVVSIQKVTILVFLLALLSTVTLGGSARAAEGGSSHYLPGTVGDIAIALVPEPGLQVANTVFYQSGDLGTAILGGEVDVNIDMDFVLNMVGAAYTFETPVLGANYTVGAVIPFGYANVDAELSVPGVGTVGDDDDSFDLSDIAVVPIQLNWKVGDFSFKFAEVIFAPTGGFDEGDAANLGRNYWSFATVGAVTWFNTGTGTEISIAPGIMVNTKNNDTNYQTGEEFHVDFVGNQFLSETFALGLRGYYYRQVSGDSGSGAVLGDFKGESLGLGPGFFWTPEFAKGNLTLQGKWMHDVIDDNRFDSDYLTFSLSWKF
jgi:hypothetical protein